MNDTISNHSNDFTYFDIRFWPLLILNVPSVICSVFLLTLLLYDRNLRTALHNHLIIILLFVNLISQLLDNPAYLSYLDHRQVWPATPAMCIIWILVAYQFYITSTLIVALASVQRHILIFYQRQCLSTSKRRLYAHYLPISILLIYSFTYGIVVLILLIRDNYPYDFSARMCGGLSEWILNYPSLSIFDLIINGLLPAPIIAVASMALLIRVLRQKKRLLRRIEWQKQRKMTVQLLSISCLFIVINLPPIIMYVLEMLFSKKYLMGFDVVLLIFRLLTYYQSVFLPFICWIPLWKNSKLLVSKLIRNHVTEISWKQRTGRVYPMHEQQKTPFQET